MQLFLLAEVEVSNKYFNMEFIISIVTEKHNPTLSIKSDNDDSMLFMIQLIGVFADEVTLEKGLCIKGRTYQQKNEKLLSDLRTIIQNNGNYNQLWQFYGILSELEDGEYFAIATKVMDDGEYARIKDDLLHLNHPDYEDLLKFKDEFCSGIVENYNFVHYENGKKQVTIGESDKSKRICRYCGKKMPDVTFAKVAHTISEGLGNKSIITNDECDSCNENLGRNIEQDLITYLSPLRTFMSINGKHGKSKIKDDSFALYESVPKSLRFDLMDKENPDLKHWSFQQEGDNFKVSFTHPQKINPQDVYRTVAKYAIGVMSDTELLHFKDTILWIRGEKSARDLPRLCFFLDNDPLKDNKPCITVFFRKNDDKTLPYSFVELQVSGVVIFAIIPFCDQDERTFSDKQDWDHTMDVLKIYRKMPWLKILTPNQDEAIRITYNFDFNKRAEGVF